MSGRHSWIRNTLALALVMLVAPASLRAADFAAVEKLPAGIQVLKLEVFPAKIELSHPFDYRQLLITGRGPAGEGVDLTRAATLSTSADILAVSNIRLVRPKANGTAELTVTYGNLSAKVPVVSTGYDKPRDVSYVQDVMPILAKGGCNSGTCHGAQQGKNGFQLSLRGYDPLFDYQALTDDLHGRRFNRSAPSHSLMLMKPAGDVPHMGGIVFRAGDPHYELLKSWIAAGVKLDLDKPRVTKIEILPQNPQLPLETNKQQMVVLAHYSDKTIRDVSAEAFIDSSLAEVVEMDKTGLATAIRRGEAAVLARYEGAYAATTITVMGDRTGFAWQEVPENNYVDTLVYNKLKQVKILPSELCTDAEFIRRLYIDLTGTAPEPEEVRAFLADTRPTRVKRDELVDKLVGSGEYVDHWTHKWADLMQVNRKFLGEKGTFALQNWIRQAVASNMPWDKFAYEILTASGSTHENPQAGYFRVVREPDETAENVTHLFLSIRFNCNKCHDHPFERWNQTQYYQFAAFFAQIGRKKGPQTEEEVIYDVGGGDVKHARTQLVTPPEVPYQPELAPKAATRREQLAKWITAKENQYFAMAFANRMWSYMLGLGIIDPVDDIRAGNPPTNPELLKRLTDEFVASGFNTQELVRTICKSRVYQHSINSNKWNDDDKINFSHAIPRRLSAEVLLDTIHTATGAKIRFDGMPVGFRATNLPDSSVQVKGNFLDLFGRPPRESPCECERSTGVVLGQIQSLINGPIVSDAVQAGDNRIAKLVKTEMDDAKLVEGLFLAMLNRFPTDKELAAGIDAVKAGGSERLEMEAALAKFEKEVLPGRQAEWEKSQSQETTWTVLDPTDLKSTGGATLTKQADGSILATGAKPVTETYTLVVNTDLAGITGVKLEVLPDASLGAQGPGRADNGNFVLNEFRLAAAPKADPAKGTNAVLTSLGADFSQEGWAVAGAVDGNPATGWAVSPQFGKEHSAIFESKDPLGAAGGTTLTFTLDQSYGMAHVIGKLRLSATTAKKPIGGKSNLPAPLAAALAVPADQRNDAQKAEIAKYYRTIDGDLVRMTAELGARGPGGDPRLMGAQDLVWALINSPAFLFNR